MADGIAALTLANKWLNMLAGSSFSAPAATYVQLHTGPPGASGTSNVSSVTTREAVSWGSASAGALAASNTPTWASWAGTNGEIVTDVSVWDATTAGNFLFSGLLAGAAFDFTATNASPCVFTAPGSAYTATTPVVISPVLGESLPAGFSASTIYFIVSPSGITFELAATSGGSAINSTSTGAGIVQASGAQTVTTGSTLQLTALTMAFTPVAA